MKHEVKGMTNKEAKALLKAIEIIIELSETKEEAKENVKKIANELKKEPINPDQGN